MIENNPTAKAVVKVLIDTGGMQEVLNIDSMNIRGDQLEVAYKNFANQKLDVLLNAVNNNDPQLVNFVNEHMPPDYPHKAVVFGSR